MKGPRRKLFIDLADPEKRTSTDIKRALELIGAFQKHFDVILGLNEKEGYEIGRNLGLNTNNATPEGLQKLCQEIHQRIGVDSVVVHPTAFAIFMIWQISFNVLGHCGYELYPSWFLRSPLGLLLNTTTHHAQHHETNRANFSLYFNFWDRLMGTNHQRYKERFEDVVGKNPATTN
jgi:hypothetical protein